MSLYLPCPVAPTSAIYYHLPYHNTKCSHNDNVCWAVSGDPVPCRPETGGTWRNKVQCENLQQLSAARCRAQGQPPRLCCRLQRPIACKQRNKKWPRERERAPGSGHSALRPCALCVDILVRSYATGLGAIRELLSYATIHFLFLTKCPFLVASLGDRAWWMSCQEIAPLLQPSAALMLVLHKKPLDFPVMTECTGPHYCKHQSIKLHDFELFSINKILRGSINLSMYLR